MGNFVGNNVSSGSVIYASDHNELVNRIGAVVNGGLDDNNISGVSGSKISGGTVPASALATSINPNTLLAETIQPFVQSGCVWSSVSGLNGAMTAGVIYVGPSGIIYRVSISSVSSHGFTASKDTYIDIDYTGVITYQEVANNAASPALTANSIRIAIVVTNGSTITSVNQGSIAATAPVVSSVTLTVVDSLGNLIHPRNPNSKVLGLRLNISGGSNNTTSYVLATGLSVPVIVPTGQNIRITFFSKNLYYSAGGNSAFISIWDGTVGSGTQLAETQSATGAGETTPGACSAVTTPSSSSKTYNIGIKAGAANIAAFDASLTAPANVIVELI